MSNFIEIIILELTIIAYYYYLINWFRKNYLPNYICYISIYIILLDPMVINGCLLENPVMVFLLAVITIFYILILYLVINDSEKKTKVFIQLVICILVFSYFSLVGKLEIYSISIAFFSLIWYNKLGNYFLRIFFIRVFDYTEKENNYFEKTPSYLANFLYLVIKIITLTVVWEAKLLNRVFKRIFVASFIWVSIYYYQSIVIFLAINLILNFFLVINVVLLSFLNDLNLVRFLYNFLNKKDYNQFLNNLYIIAQLETDNKTKEVGTNYFLALAVFEERANDFTKNLLGDLLVRLKEKRLEKQADIVCKLLLKEEYTNIFQDKLLIDLANSSVVESESRFEISFYLFLLELEFNKQKILDYYLREKGLKLYPRIKNSSALLVIKTPSWYININFPLMKNYYLFS